MSLNLRSISLFFLGFVTTSMAAEHTKDSVATIKKNLEEKKAVILDVREQDEWDAGHLSQAKLVPLSKLSDEAATKKALEGVDKKTIVYCHCRAGRRALTAAEALQKMGFDVRPLKQGFDELVKEGFPKAEAK